MSGFAILEDEGLFARIVAGFGHVLHSAGVPVTPERSTRFGTAIALARDPVRMAGAMRLAVEAGREAFLAGRMPCKRYAASPSSPATGLIG